MFSILNKVSKEFKGNSIVLSMDFILHLLKVLILILIPITYGELINELISSNTNTVILQIEILFSLYIASILIDYIIKRIELEITMNINIKINNRIINKYLNLPEYKLLNYELGKIYTMTNSDSFNITSYALAILNALVSAIKVIGIGIITFYINWKFALALIIIYPFSYLINKYYAKKIHRITKEVVSLGDRMVNFLKGIIFSSFEIKSQNGSHKMTNHYRKRNTEVINKSRSVQKVFINNYTTTKTISFVNYVLLILVGVYLIINNEIEVGIFVAFSSYSQMLTSTLDSLVKLNTTLQPSIVSAKRIIKFDELYDSFANDESLKEDWSTSTNNISLNNVTFAYKENEVLRDLSLEFELNKMYCISGANGSGKSTLSKLISGELISNSGNIKFDTRDVRSISYSDIKKHITYVSSNRTLFNISIIDNLLIEENSSRKYDAAIDFSKSLGLHKDIISLEDGYNTYVDKKFDLSSGQKQKIQLIRAFMKLDNIMIFDEPLANLDKQSKEVVLGYLKKYKNNRIIIVFSHDDYIVKNSDVIYYI